jgi:hypothetical protein
LSSISGRSPVLWLRGPPVYPPVQRARVAALAPVHSLRVDHPPAGARVPTRTFIVHERSDDWTSHASSFRLRDRDRIPPDTNASWAGGGDLLKSPELITSFEGQRYRRVQAPSVTQTGQFILRSGSTIRRSEPPV